MVSEKLGFRLGFLLASRSRVWNSFCSNHCRDTDLATKNPPQVEAGDPYTVPYCKHTPTFLNDRC